MLDKEFHTQRTRATLLLTRLVVVLFACIASVSPAEAALTLTQNIAVTCPSTDKSQRARNITFVMPAEIEFLVGHFRLVKGPLTAKIGKKLYGASDDGELVVQSPEITLVLGTSDQSLKFRLVVSDATLCAEALGIEVGFTVAGVEEEAIELRFVAGPETATTLTDADRKAFLQQVSNKYFDEVSYFVGTDQRWLTEFLPAVEDDGLRLAFGNRFCNGCSWAGQQRLALALAEFVESTPGLLNATSFQSSELMIRFPEPDKFICEGYGMHDADIDPERWYSTSSENDGILQLSANDNPISFLEFRSRRALGSNAIALERVVVSGKIIADRCEKS